MTFFKYTPALVDPKTLKKISIGRKEEITRINEILHNASAGNSLSHTIIVGPYGIGKTHLLMLIYHAVKSNIKIKESNTFKDHFIPVIFPGNRCIASVEKFILFILENIVNADDKIVPTVPGEILKSTVFGDVEKEHSLSYLRHFKKKSGKILLLMIDNIDEVLGLFSREDQALFRDILMTADGILLVGASSTLFESIREHNRPFYNFFEIIWLKDLTFEESKKLLKKYAEIDKKKETSQYFRSWETKLKAIYELTGGNPRILLDFYHVIASNVTTPVEKIFLKILDELVPYFKLQMSNVSKQQREIIDAMATASHLLTPTEIAAECRLPVSVAVAQIKRLEKLGYVTRARQKRAKRVLYELKDSLLGFYRRMENPKEREKLKLMVRFYRAWYAGENISNNMTKQLPGTEEMNMLKFIHTLIEDDNRFELAVLTIRHMIQKNNPDKVRMILKEIEKNRQTELLGFLSPVSSFVDYLDSQGDNEIIERLRGEEKKLVEDMMKRLPVISSRSF